jgi:Protein of unknown function (DUF4038)/Putative collagen-binding domain of a collagenase
MRRAGTLRGSARRVAATAAAGLVIALATACGSGDDHAAAPTSSTTMPAPPTDPKFPVAVSADKRYLVDEDGNPWMMNGDSPQCMPANLSVADMEYWFANRAGHGFNSAWVNLICGKYTHGRGDASTYDGIKPFTTDDDVATPNPEYWARMDTMVDLAKKYGITLVLDPAETGTFIDMLTKNGVEKDRAYGRFLGERFKDDVNIIWMSGNDYLDWKRWDKYVAPVAQGIRDADPKKLQTVELEAPKSTSLEDPVWRPLIDLNAAYSYTPTYEIVRRAYGEKPMMPTFMVEANYEFENNDGGPKTSDLSLRRQEWWTMTSGATGQLYGNKYTWGFQDDDWKKHFDTPAVDQYRLMADFFLQRAWQDLVPDLDNHFLVKGAGQPTDQGDVLENDYATAAVTPDGTLAVVYIPTARTVEVDTSKLAQGVKATWFDPSNGSSRPAAAPYTTPGKNAVGEEDWVLVFERPSG